MVNKGRIHREIGKFMMISSNLIKSNDELMVEISFVMVGAANSDSARISFLGSTKGELAQKLGL